MPKRRALMLIPRAYRGLSISLALASVMLFAPSAYGQSSGSLPGDLETEVSVVKAENAALREQLRKIEEQQRAMLELINRLQQRLDGPPIAEAPHPAEARGTVHRLDSAVLVT